MTFIPVFRFSLLMAGLCCLCSGPVRAESPAAAAGVDAATQAKCLERLRSALSSQEFWPSMHAAEALTLAGHGAEVIGPLKLKLASETDLRQRCGLARELYRAGDQEQVAVLQAVLANPDPYGHTHACESLYKVNAHGDRELLQAAMADTQSPAKAIMAAAALGRQGDAQAFSFLRKELARHNPDSSPLAAWVLAVIGGPEDIPGIKAAMAKAETPRQRAYFEHALALLGDEAGKQALLKNLHHQEPGVRADAAYMAGDASLVGATDELKKLLQDENLDVSIRAAQGLLALGRRTASAPTKTTSTDAARGPKVVLTLPTGEGNSRNSEGDFIKTKDGRIRFIYTHFGKGTGSDYDVAELHERISTDGGKTWSLEDRTVVRPASGLNVMSVSLLRLPTDEIALFYLAKVSHSDCRPEMRISKDEGETWGPAIQCITDEVDYYVLNNSRAIQLKSGRIVLPICLHRTLPEKTKNNKVNDWQGELMCYLSDDNGQTWRRSKSVFKGFDPSGKRVTVQEPGVVELKDGRVMMIIRSSAGCQMLSWSEDGGETWSKAEMSTIISPISPASIKRIPSTGDLLLVWNDHAGITPELKGRRTPLTIAVSRDEGKTWEHTKNLFDNPNGWYCYIAIDFMGDSVLLGHCAGDRTKNNGLAVTDITRLDLNWLYDRQ